MDAVNLPEELRRVVAAPSRVFVELEPSLARFSFYAKEKEKEKEYEAKKQKKEAESRGADRSSADEEEMRRVTQDFENNKGECIKYILRWVLEVPIGLTSTQAQALKTGAV